MKKKTIFRWISLIAVISVLISAAFICGQGQNPPSIQEPEVDNSPSPTSMPGQEVTPTDMPDYGASVTPPPAQEQPAGSAPVRGGFGELDMVVSNTTVGSLDDPREVGVTVSVRNNASGTLSSSFTVRWYPHGQSDEVGCSWDIPAELINQGEQVVGCSYTYVNHGEMHWRTVVDADDDLQEIQEANNILEGTVNIPKPGSETSAEPPDSPIYCTWNPDSRSIVMKWQYSFPGVIDGFRIYQGITSLELELPANARQAAIKNLEPNVEYQFDVRAYIGNQESSPGACTVYATPGQ